jgi:hypothetical protein
MAEGIAQRAWSMGHRAERMAKKCFAKELAYPVILIGSNH